MCILLKAKSDIFSLFCSKVIEEKHLGFGSIPPPLLKEGLRTERNYHTPANIEG